MSVLPRLRPAGPPSRSRLGLVLVALVPLAAFAADPSPDEQLLTKHKVPTDGRGLLDYLRGRTLDDAGLKRLGVLIEELGDDSFAVRQEASRKLVEVGLLARAHLTRATRHPDLEVRRRAERCLLQIEKDAATALQVSAAAVRVLKQLKPGGAAAALLDYLPSAEDEAIAEEVRLALADLAVRDGKPEPVLVDGLKDKVAVRRAGCAVALCRAGAIGRVPGVLKLLDDPEPAVRLPVALALASQRHREAVPALIALLDRLPGKDRARVEELLCRVAGEHTPAFPADTDDSRRKYRQAWEAWWKAHGARLDGADLAEVARTLGHTVVVLLDSGKVMELDSANRVRWEFAGLDTPLDVQRLPGERVLVVEHPSDRFGRPLPGRVSERNRKGEVLWEHKVVGPLMAQRLANGNTFFATEEGLTELDKAGREVLNYTPPAGARVMRARKLPNGNIALVTTLGVSRFVLLDRQGKELKSFGVEVNTRGGRIDVTPAGHVLVPELVNNRVVERDPDGKVVRELAVEQPVMVGYLPNGHLLITSNTQKRAYELDRSGKEVWEYRRKERVTRAIRP